MRLFPSDASAPSHPTHARRRFHVGVEFQDDPSPGGHVYLLAQCNSQQLLDGNSGFEAAELSYDSRCQRRACRRVWWGLSG